ncbi:MAG: hypothetical protein JXR56_03575, partial [Candidatus Cloacimonetes bacterium]|nr:hypothetical protein [Candidatus Cloacimonadota bacterium]
MKLSVKVIIICLLMLTVSHLFGLGLMFFSNNTTQVFALDDYSVDVRIENQVAVTTVVETFRNSTFYEANPIYAFPMPADASATQVIFTVNGVTEVATLQGGNQPGNPGQGSGYGDQINNYLGTNPLIMPFTEVEVEQGSTMIMSLTFVQMLPYANSDVTFFYPS